MDLINIRRSVRKYTKQPVEKVKIEKMLQAAMQAPSAKNQQPWRFLVIQNPETLAALSETSPLLGVCNLAILLLTDKRNLPALELSPSDMGAATQNLLLSAAEQGLGACWIGVWMREQRANVINKVCQVPDYLEPYSIISIGYPEDENANHFVDRYDSAKVFYEKF